jgi:DNA-binding NarL/FixJ family response regulator
MVKKRIVIIDRDEEFTTAEAAIIKSSAGFEVVRFYRDGADALKKLSDDLPDIIIMDLDFRGLKAADFILKAREKMPNLEILITTQSNEERTVFDVLCHGASGFLLKNNCLPGLLDSLNTVVTGGSPVDPSVIRQIVRSIRINEASPLSTRESDVLKLLMQGKTYVVIADELFISGETVKTHLKNIYRKLKVNTRAQAVQKAVAEQLVAGYMGLNFNYGF